MELHIFLFIKHQLSIPAFPVLLSLLPVGKRQVGQQSITRLTQTTIPAHRIKFRVKLRVNQPNTHIFVLWEQTIHTNGDIPTRPEQDQWI